MKPEQVLDFHAHFPAKTGMARRELHPLVKAYAKELKEHWRNTFDFPEPEKMMRGIQVQGERWTAEVENHHLEKVVFMTDQLIKVKCLGDEFSCSSSQVNWHNKLSH